MKLNKIKLKNVLSHKDAEIDISPVLTVFEGVSDHGKSNIMRGLLQNLTNEPAGANLLKNGSPKGACSEVTVIGEDASGMPFEAVRKRNATVNTYIINGGDPLTVGRGQPEEMDKLLNLSQNAIQTQQGGHFLLGPNISDGQVARTIGSAIGLTEIDNMFAHVRKLKVTNDDLIRAVELVIKNESEVLVKFDGLDECDEPLKEYQRLIERSVELQENIDEIERILGLWHTTKPDISTLVAECDGLFLKVCKVSDALTLIVTAQHELAVIEDDWQALKPDMQEQLVVLSELLSKAIGVCECEKESKRNVEAVECLISDLEKTRTVDADELQDIAVLITDVEKQIEAYRSCQKEMQDIDACIQSIAELDNVLAISNVAIKSAESAYKRFLDNNPVCSECGALQKYWDK